MLALMMARRCCWSAERPFQNRGKPSSQFAPFWNGLLLRYGIVCQGPSSSFSKKRAMELRERASIRRAQVYHAAMGCQGQAATRALRAP